MNPIHMLIVTKGPTHLVGMWSVGALSFAPASLFTSDTKTTASHDNLHDMSVQNILHACATRLGQVCKSPSPSRFEFIINPLCTVSYLLQP